jgi:hypothetical protein
MFPQELGLVKLYAVGKLSIEVQCSAVQYSAVQCSAVQCSAVQGRITVQCRVGWQCSAVQGRITVQCSAG